MKSRSVVDRHATTAGRAPFTQLSATTTELQWFTDGYALPFAGPLLPFGDSATASDGARAS
ncbi:hypothetical protein ACFVHW_06250 [Streptomyces sp. NPDC127110]|uniref:hypothetical protein n=1 Tax=Streptomyces sp. NPDC127110 TaxID=3345362 RepID=UPI00362D69B7